MKLSILVSVKDNAKTPLQSLNHKNTPLIFPTIRQSHPVSINDRLGQWYRSTSDYVRSQLRASVKPDSVNTLLLTDHYNLNEDTPAILRKEVTERLVAEGQLQQFNQYIQAFNNISSGLIAHTNTYELFEAILKHASELAQTPHVYLGLNSADITEPNTIKIVFTNGFFDRNKNVVLKKGEGIGGQVWQKSEVVLVPNYAEWAHHYTKSIGFMKACIGLPLKSGIDVIGVLVVGYDQIEQTFTPAQVDLLTKLAQLASVVYTNVELRKQQQATEDKLRQRNSYLQALNDTAQGLHNRLNKEELLQQIVIKAVELLNVEDGYVYLLDEHERTMTLRFGVGKLFSDKVGFRIKKGEGLSGQVWIRGKSVNEADYATCIYRVGRFDTAIEMHAMVAAPMVSSQRTIGVIGVAHRDTSKKFDAEQVSLLEQLARWASVAFDNTNLYDVLRSERDFAKQITDTINQGMMVETIDGKFNYVNPILTQWLGYSAADLINAPYTKIFQPEDHDEIAARRQQMLLTQTPIIWERRLLRKNGSYLYALVSSTPRKVNGKIEGVFSVITDLTEIKQTEEALRRARNEAEDTSRMKSQFLAMIGHELRTPLNGIMGFTELLLSTALDDEQNDYAKTAYNSAQALLEIIESILDFSRVATNEISIENKPFAPTEVILEVMDQFKMRAGQSPLTLSHVINDNVPHTVIGDPQRVRQALATLVSNGLKFTSQGSVSVHVETIMWQTSTSIDTNNTGDNRLKLRFSVRDTGVGINEEAQTKIFQPFIQADGSFRRRYNGIGLGLSICKHLIELMGGEIGIESIEGKGSTFWFVLPFESAYTTEDEFDLRFMDYIR